VRVGTKPTNNGQRERPAPLPVAWPFRVHEVPVPCTGKLQPEHLLKAFEAGTDAVCVLACDAGNCHYLEGSRRVQRRVEYVRGILDEVGLGGERLLLYHLPGSAKEDAALGCGAKSGARNEEEAAGRLKGVAAEIAGKLKALGRSPLHQDGLPS
jgi:coenzyme F420-reducing hydrogenase delta subunit